MLNLTLPLLVVAWIAVSSIFLHSTSDNNNGGSVSGFTITTSTSTLSSTSSSLLLSTSSSFLLSIRQHQQQQDYQYRKKKKKTPSLLFLSPLSSTDDDDDDDKTNDNDIQYDDDGIAIAIEYCPGCRWMTKSFWIATELLLVSSDEQNEYDSDSDYNINVGVDGSLSVVINSIKIIPSLSGTFKITGRRATSTSSSSDTDITTDRTKPKNNNDNTVLLWDRTVDDGFPPIDLIELNTRIKKYYFSLHNNGILESNKGENGEEEKAGEATATASTVAVSISTIVSVSSADIVIRYCSKQRYLFRAVYYGQELFTTFNDGEITSITLVPITTTTTNTTTTGVQHEEEHGDYNQIEETQVRDRTSDFTIELLKTSMNKKGKEEGDDDEEEIVITEQQQHYLLWDASSSEETIKTETTSCKFPEVKILKRLIRDCITPNKSLGHSDDHINININSSEITTTTTNNNTNENEDNGSGGECIPCNSNKKEENDDDDDDDEDEEDNADAEADARRFFGVM